MPVKVLKFLLGHSANLSLIKLVYRSSKSLKIFTDECNMTAKVKSFFDVELWKWEQYKRDLWYANELSKYWE